MGFRKLLKSFTDSPLDQLLFLFAIALTLLSLVGLWIDIKVGVAMLILFVAGAYLVNVLLLREQQRKLSSEYRQHEALHLLMNLLSFRLPLPSMTEGAAAPDLLVLLCREILARKPQCIVECGAGVSTLVIGYVLEKIGQGQLITLEHEAFWADRVGQWIKQHHLEARVKVIFAPLAQNLIEGKTYEWYSAEAYQPILTTLPPIDLLFVDGPPGLLQAHTRLPAVPCLRHLFSPQCVIIMDDMDRESEAYMARLWADQLNYHLELFPNFEKGAALLQPIPDKDSQDHGEGR